VPIFVSGFRVNTIKLLRRLAEQPDPPCLKCDNYFICEESSKCCEAFIEYVENETWNNKDFIPIFDTELPNDCIMEKDIQDRCGISYKELRQMLFAFKRKRLAFEPKYFYSMLEIERGISKIYARSERLRKAKIALCKIVLEKTQRINTERTRHLVAEIRRNVWCITRGVC